MRVERSAQSRYLVRMRPFDPDLADEICAALAEGISLSKWVRARRDTDGAIAMKTIYQWLRTEPEFAENYARAREDQADTYAEEVVELADEMVGKAKNATDCRIAEQRIKSRQWAAENLKPKTYGKRVDVTTNNDHTVGKTPDEERALRAAAILKRVEQRRNPARALIEASEVDKIVQASSLFD